MADKLAELMELAQGLFLEQLLRFAEFLTEGQRRAPASRLSPNFTIRGALGLKSRRFSKW